MDFKNEILVLKAKFAALAKPPQQKFLAQHNLRGWNKRVLPWYLWEARIKHQPLPEECQGLLIWAVGIEKSDLRQMCSDLKKHLDRDTKFLPVLLTDVADFAWFSRLGWLVEYLPQLANCKKDYANKKLSYLAWRYRHYPVIPASLGFADQQTWQENIGDLKNICIT